MSDIFIHDLCLKIKMLPRPSREDSVGNSDNHPMSSRPICKSIFNEAVTREHLAAGALDYQAAVEQDV